MNHAKNGSVTLFIMLSLALAILSGCGRADGRDDVGCTATANFDNKLTSGGYTIVAFEAIVTSCKGFFLERTGSVQIEVRVEAPRSSGRLSKINFGDKRNEDLSLSNPSGVGLTLALGSLLYTAAPNKSWNLPWNDAPQSVRVEFQFPEGTEIAGMPYSVEVRVHDRM